MDSKQSGLVLLTRVALVRIRCNRALYTSEFEAQNGCSKNPAHRFKGIFGISGLLTGLDMEQICRADYPHLNRFRIGSHKEIKVDSNIDKYLNKSGT